MVGLEAVAAARGVPQVVAGLVSALRVQGNCLSALGRPAEALSLLDEAITVADAAEEREVPLFELGLVHLGRGNGQAALGRLDEALDGFLAAAAILRDVPGRTPLLAEVLILAAQCHRELGHDLAGLPLLVEAVGHCRALVVDRHSAAALAGALTGALWEMVLCQEPVDGAGADAAATEGIDFYRTWKLSRLGEPSEAALHYAGMLGYHCDFLAQDGRVLDALPFGVEATGILRGLAGMAPEAFLPAFLDSLAGQVELLQSLGRYAEADLAADEYARWAPS